MGDRGCKDRKIKDKKNNLGLATDLNMVYSCLDLRPKNIEQIIEETGLSPAKQDAFSQSFRFWGWHGKTGGSIMYARTCCENKTVWPRRLWRGKAMPANVSAACKLRSVKMAKYLVIVESPAKVKP